MPRHKGGATRISPSEVQSYLRGIEFPCSKEDILNQVQQNNAPQEVQQIIEHLPDQEFSSVADVTKALKESQ